MAEREVTVRLNYEVSGNAMAYLERLEAAQASVANGQAGVGGGMPTGGGGGSRGRGGDDRRTQQVVDEDWWARRQARESRREEAENRRREASEARTERIRRAEEARIERSRQISMHDVRAARLFWSLAVVGTYHAAVGTAEAAGAVGAATQRADMTGAQRARAGIQEMPIVGRINEAALGIAHAIDGTTESIRAANQRMTWASAAIQGAAQYESARVPLEFAAKQAGNRATALSRVRPVHIASGDETTFGGAFAFEAETRAAPLRQNIAVARAEAEAARASIEDARREDSRIDAPLAAARQRRDDAQRRWNEARARENGRPVGGANAAGAVTNVIGQAIGMGPVASGAAGNTLAASWAGRPADTVNALTDLITANREVIMLENQRIKTQEQIRAAVIAAGGAEADVTRNVIALRREELATMESRKRLMTEGAQNLFMMNPYARQMGENAFRDIQERGIENVPLWRIQQASEGGFGNTVGRMATEAGSRLPGFAFRESVGEYGQAGLGGTSLSSVRSSSLEIRNALQNLELTVKTDEANRILSGMSGTLQNILNALLGRAQAEVQQVPLQQFLQNSQQAR